MRVATPKKSTETTIPQKAQSSLLADSLIIPLRKEIIEINPKEFMTFKLRSDPRNEKSITYSVYLAPFNTGSPEQWLIFLKTLKVIFQGENLALSHTREFLWYELRMM